MAPTPWVHSCTILPATQRLSSVALALEWHAWPTQVLENCLLDEPWVFLAELLIFRHIVFLLLSWKQLEGRTEIREDFR